MIPSGSSVRIASSIPSASHWTARSCWPDFVVREAGSVVEPHLLWIGGLSLFVLVEKLAPAGPWPSRLAGAGLVLWGAATLASMSIS